MSRPEDWDWSSFRNHLTGERRVVEIESRVGQRGPSEAHGKAVTNRYYEDVNYPALASLERGTRLEAEVRVWGYRG